MFKKENHNVPKDYDKKLSKADSNNIAIVGDSEAANKKAPKINIKKFIVLTLVTLIIVLISASSWWLLNNKDNSSTEETAALSGQALSEEELDTVKNQIEESKPASNGTPEDKKIYYVRIISVYAEQNKCKEAMAAYNEAGAELVKQIPADLAQWIGNCYATAGDKQNAKVAFQNAINTLQKNLPNATPSAKTTAQTVINNLKLTMESL